MKWWVITLKQVRKIGTVARAIAIMSHPIPNTNGSHSVQVIIPQKQLGRKSDMWVPLYFFLYVFVVSSISISYWHTFLILDLETSLDLNLIAHTHTDNYCATFRNYSDVCFAICYHSLCFLMLVWCCETSLHTDRYVFCCSYSHNVAPKGKFIAFVSTDAETDNPQTELKAGIDLLGPVDEIFFDMYDRYEPVNEPALDNCFISTVRGARPIFSF